MRTVRILVAIALVFVLSISTTNSVGFTTNQAAKEGLFSGVVKENNPSLGYITLYFEDGLGTSPELDDSLAETRTYTYGYEIPAIRDGYTVDIDQIMPGDKVFLSLDEFGYIEQLSAKSYYQPVYGTVHYNRFGTLVIKKDNGSFVSYKLSKEIPIYKNNRPCAATDIIAGDQARILVQVNGANIHIGAIEIEKNSRPISGIYRGEVEFYNSFNHTLGVSRVQTFINGRWEALPSFGIHSFPYSKDYSVVLPRRPSGTVYFATRQDYGGVNRIVMSSFVGKPGYELLLNDTLLNIGYNSKLELENSSANIISNGNTIVVKDGRLVDISTINPMDRIMLSTNKSSLRNEYIANVLVSETRIDTGIKVYRGRINSIVPEKTITVESFAVLNGVNWEFTNTPKTFGIDIYSSRLLEEDGLSNFRDLREDYVQQTVYIVADGTKILLMSNAPYANLPVTGRVKGTMTSFDEAGDVAGDDVAEDKEASNEELSLLVSEARYFDDTNNVWKESSDTQIKIPQNAVIIKKGAIAEISAIKRGDNIKIIKHSQSGDGIILICE